MGKENKNLGVSEMVSKILYSCQWITAMSSNILMLVNKVGESGAIIMSIYWEVIRWAEKLTHMKWWAINVHRPFGGWDLIALKPWSLPISNSA